MQKPDFSGQWTLNESARRSREPSERSTKADSHDLIRVAARVDRPAGRFCQVGDRHRASPCGNGARGLDHRSRAGRRPRRGRIVFDGTPDDLVAARKTLTGEHLAAFVGERRNRVPSR